VKNTCQFLEFALLPANKPKVTMALPTESSIPTDSAGDGWFRTTNWRVVLDARGETDQADAALARLCKVYWYPLYSYVRRFGYKAEDAQDLTQEYFARLLEKHYLKAVSREKGKFRSFLLLTLKRFLANEWDKANCQKRGGGCSIISFDSQETESRYLSEPVEDLPPDKFYERQWAISLLEQVMTRLKEEYSATGKADIFEQLRPMLRGDEDQASYKEISSRAGMNEGALRVTIHRLRQRYRELLRLEIANTVETPEEIDDEIRCLFSALT
jgi:RNA polymerase sigma factor (sigma-70 family)